jgi:hypothetical protein
MKDFAFIFATVMALEIIDHAFGKAIGMAVSVTALIACLIFLYHAGAQAIEARRAETAKTGSVEDESAVPKECAQKGGA